MTDELGSLTLGKPRHRCAAAQGKADCSKCKPNYEWANCREWKEYETFFEKLQMAFSMNQKQLLPFAMMVIVLILLWLNWDLYFGVLFQ